jgi:hypothetical protein
MQKKISLGKNRLVILLISFLSILMIGTIVGLYNYANSVPIDIEIDKKQIKNKREIVLNKEKGWMDKFAKIKNDNFKYPVNEISIKLNPMFEIDKKFLYKITADNINEYKFFCINQILLKNNIKFSFFKRGSSINLMIFIKNKKILDDILIDIERYEIDFIIKEFK